MKHILLYLSILPSILLGFYIYKKDVVEKEPISLLIRSFIGGVVSGILVIILSIILKINEFPLETSTQILFYSFILVSLIEESIKFLITYLLTYKNKEFNYQYDGIVYASFVSLGFATYENLLFVFEQANIQTAIYRGLLTVPAHVFFAIFMGYYLGLAKHYRRYKSKKKERKYLCLSYIVPIVLHGFFDYCLFSQSVIGILFFLIFIFILYIISFKKVKEVSELQKHI